MSAINNFLGTNESKDNINNPYEQNNIFLRQSKFPLLADTNFDKSFTDLRRELGVGEDEKGNPKVYGYGSSEKLEVEKVKNDIFKSTVICICVCSR